MNQKSVQVPEKPRTENIRVKGVTRLVSPREVKEILPASVEILAGVAEHRETCRRSPIGGLIEGGAGETLCRDEGLF